MSDGHEANRLQHRAERSAGSDSASAHAGLRTQSKNKPIHGLEAPITSI